MNQIEHYTNQFQSIAHSLPGSGLDWMADKRRQGLARFVADGFPNQRQEDWRYTSLRPLTNKAFNLTPGPSTAAPEVAAITDLDSYRLVFVDGHYDSGLPDELASGIAIRPLSKFLNDDPEMIRPYIGTAATHNHSLTELNNALHQDGIVLCLGDGIQLDRPLELVFTGRAEAALAQPRNLVIAGKNSAATIIERYVSAVEQRTLCNGVTELFLEEGAHVDYYLVQTCARSCYQFNGVWAHQKANSRFKAVTVTNGGALVRNDIRTNLDQPGAHCDMLGAYTLNGRQHVDNHTTMNHCAPNCTSRELYKGVLDQRARGVFHGRIKVHQNAQATDAKQANHTLLLSADAEIDTKPQLEIYADDVQCAHGATIGQLDEAALFYMRCRGIDLFDARAMLLDAFIDEVLSEVSIEPLKNYLVSLCGPKADNAP